MLVSSTTDSLSIMSSADVGGSPPTTVSDQLGESDFLSLLITELENQDPLDPLSDRDFISQMAQLNTLNETIELNDNIVAMQFLQTSGLIGRGVEAIGPDGQPVSGIVTEVRYIDSEPWLVINNEVIVGLDDVIRIM